MDGKLGLFSVYSGFEIGYLGPFHLRLPKPPVTPGGADTSVQTALPSVSQDGLVLLVISNSKKKLAINLAYFVDIGVQDIVRTQGNI